MNEWSISKIVVGLLILLFCTAGCQKRSQCPHYMSQKDWSEIYKKRLEKDKAANQKRREQAAKKR